MASADYCPKCGAHIGDGICRCSMTAIPAQSEWKEFHQRPDPAFCDVAVLLIVVAFLAVLLLLGKP